MKNKPWVIFDLDGTLADISHRLDLILDKKWDESMEKIPMDKLVGDICQLYQMCVNSGYNIAIVTGRSEKFMDLTIDWLRKNFIFWDEIHFRKYDDKRSDVQVKQDIYNDFFQERKILFVVEDRDKVVSMWREIGITCLQCKKGDY